MKSPQTSEVAKKVASRVLDVCDVREERHERKSYGDPLSLLERVTKIIQSAIDAATAKVKKEESLGSETHATLDVQPEETDEVLIAEQTKIITRLCLAIDPRFRSQPESYHKAKFAKRTRLLLEEARTGIAVLRGLLTTIDLDGGAKRADEILHNIDEHLGPSGPLVSSADLAPAAPSRKQEASEAAKAAREILEQTQYYSDVMQTAKGERTITEIIQRHFDAAARVEPTKKWTVVNNGVDDIRNGVSVGILGSINLGPGKGCLSMIPLEICEGVVAAHNASCAPTMRDYPAEETFICETCGNKHKRYYGRQFPPTKEEDKKDLGLR